MIISFCCHRLQGKFVQQQQINVKLIKDVWKCKLIDHCSSLFQ